MNARKTLERYFSRIGRSVYVGSELPIDYPGERVFAPASAVEAALSERRLAEALAEIQRLRRKE